MQLTDHFTLEEMCKSSTAIRKGINNFTEDETIIANLTGLCRHALEPIRANYDTAFTPTSAYRCSALNKTLGSSNKSQHVLGQAADIEITGVDNFTLATWISENVTFDQLNLEFYQLGDPSSGWVHVSFILPEYGINRKACVTYDGHTFQTGLLP